MNIFSGRKGLEQRTTQDDERIATLEQQLAEAQLIAEDSDRKYDEVMNIFEDDDRKSISSRWIQVARRIAIMEVDLERAEDRAESAEA